MNACNDPTKMLVLVLWDGNYVQVCRRWPLWLKQVELKWTQERDMQNCGDHCISGIPLGSLTVTIVYDLRPRLVCPASSCAQNALSCTNGLGRVMRVVVSDRTFPPCSISANTWRGCEGALTCQLWGGKLTMPVQDCYVLFKLIDR